MGKSELMLPLSVSARRSASSEFGRVSAISPLTVLKLAPRGQSARPIATFTDPLTVLASARPVVDSLIDPLTVDASASPCSDSPLISPFTVRPTKLTPYGMRTSKFTVVSLFRVFERPPPGSHEFGSRPLDEG